MTEFRMDLKELSAIEMERFIKRIVAYSTNCHVKQLDLQLHDEEVFACVDTDDRFALVEIAFNSIADNGKEILIWFRDDDVGIESARLEKVLGFAEEEDIPLTLAVIPKDLQKKTIDRIYEGSNILIGQHGYSHKNYLPDLDCKSELCETRTIEAIIREQRLGNQLLEKTFGDKYSGILIPPFFEIDESVRNKLDEIVRYKAFSGWGDNGINKHATPDINVQVDLVNWSEAEKYAGHEYLTCQFLRELEKIEARNDWNVGIIGVVLHHELLTEEAYSDLHNLIKILRQTPGVHIVDVLSALIVLQNNRCN